MAQGDRNAKYQALKQANLHVGPRLVSTDSEKPEKCLEKVLQPRALPHGPTIPQNLVSRRDATSGKKIIKVVLRHIQLYVFEQFTIHSDSIFHKEVEPSRDPRKAGVF
jgi:hypothetical protein